MNESSMNNYVQLLDDFINTTLARAIVEGEKIPLKSGDVYPEVAMEIDNLERQIIELLFKNMIDNSML